MASLLAKHLAATDTMHNGRTSWGHANALTLTFGLSFPRIAGGYLLYRGLDDPTNIDWTDPVGSAGFDATAVRNFAWRGHAADAQYVYGLRAIGGGGVEEAVRHNIVRANFTAGGALKAAVPNCPYGLTVWPEAGGTFTLDFVYSARRQAIAPGEFRIYHDNGSGTMDWATSIGAVGFAAGQQWFEFTSGAYAHGVRVRFGVRAASAAGDEEMNTATESEVAVATPPPALSFVSALEGLEQ